MASLNVDAAGTAPTPWLVSRRFDLAVFGGPAAVAFLLLGWAAATGTLNEDTPTWAWIAAVVFVDVAHVWATSYRVYLDPEERRRRPGLYLGVPVAVYVASVLLYSGSSALFWRVLAYLAVFHFVRQQYGWVALYRRRLGVASRLDRVLDDATVYSATVFPVVYWHAHLPRQFAWFLQGDFVPGLPEWVSDVLHPAHLALTAAWVLRQVYLRLRGRPTSAGKDLVIATTWLTWYVGIVVLDSDFAFTVTNVLVHGVPYLGLVWVYGRRRFEGSGAAVARLFRPAAWPLFLATLVAVAWFEEWGWDRVVWHERASLFRGRAGMAGPEALAVLVPLLALPQATHYVLDAWIWRSRGNPGLARLLFRP
jgi:hypothetical protein